MKEASCIHQDRCLIKYMF